MKRTCVLWAIVFLALAGLIHPSDAMEKLKSNTPRPSRRLLVRFKPAIAEQIEKTLPAGAVSVAQVPASSPLTTFFSTHRLRRMEALHKELVGQKRRSRKSAAGLAAEVRVQFPKRARRFQGAFLPPDLTRTYVVEPMVSSDAELNNAAASLREDRTVEFVEIERVYRVQFTPNDPYYARAGGWGQLYDDLYGLKRLSTAGAWDINKGSGVVVGVVDTGIDYNHPDLAANVWTKAADGSHGYDFINDTNKPMDDHGHGTHVAGTIAAVGNNGLGVIGVAWNAQVMGLKGLDAGGFGTTSSLSQSIRWAADQGADLINMSWVGEGDADPVLTDALQYAYNLGVVLVGAAGNNASDIAAFYPANTPWVIAVSAFDWNDQFAGFSNYGQKLDLAAPGVNILSLQAAGTALGPIVSPGYIYISGTSMAAPHVTGVAALILSKHPEYSNEQLRWVLRKSADDLEPPGFDVQSGYGRVNALRAVKLPTAPLPTPPTAAILVPSPGATLAGLSILSGTASDMTGITKVSIEVDGVSKGNALGTTSWTYTLDTRLLANGPHTLTARAINLAGLPAIGSVSVQVLNAGQADYSATLKAPVCLTPGPECQTGSFLLGRGGLIGGPEVNPPNTLQSSCADGTAGYFHTDESLDWLRVSTLEGGPIAPGKTVKIEAKVWAFSGQDTLDLFYAANAGMPSWKFIQTLPAPGSGFQLLYTTYTVPAGQLQAVRGQFRYLGDAVPCTNGPYDDHDDMAFAVDTTPALPDLVITEFGVSPHPATPKGIFRMTLKVRNQGGAATSPLTTLVYLNTSSFASWSASTPSLGAGQEWVVSLVSTAPVAEQLHGLHAVVRSTSPETNSANNDAYTYVTVSTSPATETFLSGLPWISTASVSQIRRNGNVNNILMRLNGIPFTKGLGVRANADVVFPLPANEQCSVVALTGVDDEVKNKGSVIYRILMDGTTRYASASVFGGAAAQSIAFDVTGGRRLTLRVTDNNDGNADDVADWALARLRCNLVPDTKPPGISAVSVKVSGSSTAIVHWVTDELSHSEVAYGTTTAYALGKADFQAVTDHTVALTGLVKGVPYHYRISSRDPFGNQQSTPDATLIIPASTGPSGTGSAAFKFLDSVTQGSWKGTYGGDGYAVHGDVAVFPGYAQVGMADTFDYVWAPATSDPRALQKGAVNQRSASTWYSPEDFKINVYLTDGATHQIGLYVLDWDGWNGPRSETIQVSDSNGFLLDSRNITDFSGGRYLVWEVKGQVRFTVTNLNPNSNAVVSGIFFGKAGQSINPSILPPAISPDPNGNVRVASVNTARIYPNPWRANRDGGTPLVFDQLPPGSTVKLFSLAGRSVGALTADGSGRAAWDVKNNGGDPVASGIYLYVIHDPQNNQTRGKLAVIR